MAEHSKVHELMTIRQVALLERYRHVFTEQKLRALIAKADESLNAAGIKVRGNGLYEFGAIVRVGRRVFIDVEAFDRWVASRRFSPVFSANNS